MLTAGAIGVVVGGAVELREAQPPIYKFVTNFAI